MVVLDNKKNKKKQNTTVVPVYLGYPDSQVDQNDASVDAFQSYIGGYPIWFDDTQIPEQRIINCGGCGNPMYLLVQVYAPLDHRPHERVIYVWGCNRRQCMRKPHR
ncbi:hypothetical protein BDF22DRAFT_617915 [Syncephalis plumigaleata]|nr:hypothetical protein BDF22DRAFT_617915 [Syncephalis plumigaleata]